MNVFYLRCPFFDYNVPLGLAVWLQLLQNVIFKDLVKLLLSTFSFRIELFYFFCKIFIYKC